MPPYSAAVPIAHALVEASPDRVLWGTDFPHPNATHEADEADLVDLVPQFAPETRCRSDCWWTIRRGFMVSAEQQ